MALTLMYITNRPEVAEIAQKAGVDRIWIDMEYIGKSERQGGMDTVQNHHTIEDIKRLRPILNKSDLLVRINPIHKATLTYSDTKQEIEDTIAAGADIIMLPMFKTEEDVKFFLDVVNGRTKTILLLETAEAVNNLDQILKIEGIDEIHIGLNDLHLAYNREFMFELLADGTVESISRRIKRKNIKFGFGGIARVGYGDLPAELIISEHYRLGSTMAILSRGFCNANTTLDVNDIEKIFIDGIKGIRSKEMEISNYDDDAFINIHKQVIHIVNNIVKNRLEVKGCKKENLKY